MLWIFTAALASAKDFGTVMNGGQETAVAQNTAVAQGAVLERVSGSELGDDQVCVRTGDVWELV